MKNPNRAPGDKPERTAGAAPDNGGNGQDAIALLKSDHREVEGLFEQYEAASSTSEKSSLATKICRALIVHTLLEEELFYPACREKDVEDGALDEAQVEHDSAKLLIAELMTGKPGNEYFDAKVKVLSEYIKLHVGEEEDPGDGIFAKAQTAGVDMNALGERIQTRKPQLLGQVESPRFPPPSPRSLNVRMVRTTDPQERTAMPRYSQDLERDERGRFMSDDDHRGYGSRYHDEDNYRRSSNGDRPRNDHGQFMRDDDYDRGRGYARYGRNGNDRDRDEHGRFMSHDERGGMYSSRDRYGDDYRPGSYRERDDEERFASRGYYRGRDDDGRNDGRGWYGDPRGHSEAAERGWESRHSGRYADDDDYRRGNASNRGRHEDDDHRGHGGWFGDPEGHAEASRRGWRNR